MYTRRVMSRLHIGGAIIALSRRSLGTRFCLRRCLRDICTVGPLIPRLRIRRPGIPDVSYTMSLPRFGVLAFHGTNTNEQLARFLLPSRISAGSRPTQGFDARGVNASKSSRQKLYLEEVTVVNAMYIDYKACLPLMCDVFRAFDTSWL